MTAAIKVAETRAGSRIVAIGSYLPRRVVTNAEMCTMIDSTDEWIQQRTGIKERRWAGDDEQVQDMAYGAATQALSRAGMTAADIDCVIVATVSYTVQTPALAPLVAAQLGCVDAAAYDVSAACAGFCYSLAQADSLIRTGSATNVLVIGVERLSDITDKSDRGTAFLFADGAGAAVVSPSDVPGIGPVVWGSDGAQAGALKQSEDFRVASPKGYMPTLEMDGKAVFLWATTFIAGAARRVLEKSGVNAHDLDVFVPHQANNRITDSMLRHLKLPEHVVVARAIERIGNTSAASVPLAMDELLTSGQARSGQTALIIGFGAGLAYAGQVVTLP